MEFEKPYPFPTPTTETYWRGLHNEKVILQRCSKCARWIFYPRTHCPTCLNPNPRWVEVSGNATLYAFTVTHQPTAPHFADEVPQFLAIVELSEGVRLTSTLVNVDEIELKIGMPLRPFFDHISSHHTLLRFEPC